MFDALLESGFKVGAWFSSRCNRLRLGGARIEVITFVVSRQPSTQILLARSAYHDIWMVPQEGVMLAETFDAAIDRCLEVEFGLSETQRSRIYNRSCTFIGRLDLPADRHGERLVADDATGTLFEHVRLRRKAYWAATLIVGSIDELAPKPNGTETLEFVWATVPESIDLFRNTNHPEKAELLVRATQQVEAQLRGGKPPRRLP